MHNCNTLALDNYILRCVCCYGLLKSRQEILIVILGDFFSNDFLCIVLTGNFLKSFSVVIESKFAEKGDNR